MHTRANGEETCRLLSGRQEASIMMSATPARSDAEPRNQISRIIDRLRFCEDALRNGVPEEYFGWAGDQPSLGELAQSDASAGPQDVRAKHAVYRIENECFVWDKSFNSEQAYWIIRSALAQSDAEPPNPKGCYGTKQSPTLRDLKRAQSDAEPVAWYRSAKPLLGVDIQWGCPRPGAEWEPLYTSPPRPDASAGLIEAAEYCEKEMSHWSGDAWSDGVRYGLKIAAKNLRRAADRSGK